MGRVGRAMVNADEDPLQPARQHRPRLREDQIVIAAETCFQRGGFQGTAMSQIAKEARVSVGQIYRYFPSKAALVGKIVERDTDRTLALVEAAFDSGEDKAATLLAQVRPAVERAADPARCRLMLEIAAEASRNPSVSVALQAVDQAGRERFGALLQAINPQIGDKAEIEARVEVLSLLMEGLPWRLARNPDMDLEHFCSHLGELVRDLLVIKPRLPARAP